MSAPFESVLVANRGEIALRIQRTLRRLDIRSLLACHPIDAESPAARAADEVVWLEASEPVAAYLDGAQIAERARNAGAEAIHPGYGFLAESADFAEQVAAAGLCFVGPSPAVIRLMGDKIASRAFVAEHGFRVAESIALQDEPEQFREQAQALGFPLLIKAAAGGGGKGMHVAPDAAALDEALRLAAGEAERFFGDGRLYAEPYLERPRHIEVQVLGDAYGDCLHLFERECSIQRRFQKIVEESPAPNLPPELRQALHAEALGIARAAGYQSAGTIEFIVGPGSDFSFLEMNTRLQVEHPVTELVTGLDLVAAQLRVAAGEPLSIDPDTLAPRGHAIECRVCAEDPAAGFRPATGTLYLVREPAGDGIRFDSGVAAGSRVTTDFDPLLAKLVAHGRDREQAIARARAALRETVLLGVTTNTAYLERILGHRAFAEGSLHTDFVLEHAADLRDEPGPDLLRDVVAAAALSSRAFADAVRAIPRLHAAVGRWRN